ncbi:hypothetical protein [uncultured Campylobacter sp.]|uniref:hypothetical protein n=1 Tax=uncultured Campylobacter sp. TaxID=218934 RepID=UPI00261AE0F8|nr:hypothetical protein [uncultured Campylobacter sp.]
MIKKIFVVLSLSTFIINLSFATDLLAFYTNGKLTEKSPGVKVLGLEEKKQVRGGYYDSFHQCGINQCFALANHAASYFTMTQRELSEWNALTYGDLYLFVGFMAQNNWSVSSLGKPYNYFTYDAILYDARTGHMYKQSKQVLNSNLIVRQLSIKYKDQFDRYFGGLQSRAVNRIAK